MRHQLLRRLVRSRDGSVIMETALMITILLVLMFGIIDLGRIATDALFLAIDPYPRKPGVVFEAEVTAPDPEDHPFAALKALQDNKQGKKKGK